jgi:hypothetical protein
MTPIQCFFVEPTGQVELYLRRYVGSDVAKCPGPMSYHNAMKLLGDAPASEESRPKIPHDDPRWPTECVCGYQFTADDAWQLYTESVYVRKDTGEEFSIRSLPVGAIYFADWMLHEGSNQWRGPDGHCLVVMVPGKDGRAHEWMVDGRCNNCKLPDDCQHKCWVRHGNPQTEPVHVDKNGLTCQAGGGSIQTEGWHGFLTRGFLQEQR